MEYRPLGRTGIKVSPLCLGGMMLGWWGENDYAASEKLILRAVDAGINFIDTADMYAGGQSEEFIGECLARHGLRDRVVLATKVHFPMGDDPNQGGNGRRWIMRAVEDSLRRLRTDRIDVYQLHRPDPAVDIDETLGALTDLVRAARCATSAPRPSPPTDRRGAAGGRAARPGAVRHRAAAVLAARPRRRGRRAAAVPGVRHGRARLDPLAGGWLTGRYRAGRSCRSAGGRRCCRSGTTWRSRRTGASWS